MKGVVTQFFDDERRRVEHVLESRQLFAPVLARSVRLFPPRRFEILERHHPVPNPLVGAERGRVTECVEPRLQLTLAARDQLCIRTHRWRLASSLA